MRLGAAGLWRAGVPVRVGSAGAPPVGAEAGPAEERAGGRLRDAVAAEAAAGGGVAGGEGAADAVAAVPGAVDRLHPVRGSAHRGSLRGAAQQLRAAVLRAAGAAGGALLHAQLPLHPALPLLAVAPL